MFCLVSLLFSYHPFKAIEHLVHPTFASHVDTEDIGVQNADIPPRSVPSPTSSARMPMMASPASSLHQPPRTAGR